MQQQTTAGFLQQQIHALQTLASTDPTHWESCNLAISNLQRQLALLLSNPSPERKAKGLFFIYSFYSPRSESTGNGLPGDYWKWSSSQFTYGYSTSIAKCCDFCSFVSSKFFNNVKVTKAALSDSNSSGRQPRIDQMFAPTSRPMSTSSKPSDKPREPKQEPS